MSTPASEVAASATGPEVIFHDAPAVAPAATSIELEEMTLFFRQFKKALSLAGQSSSPRGFNPVDQHPIVPEHLNNAQYIYQERVNGFLSKQFPTIGNPAPLGLCAFALTTFVLSMFNVGASQNTSGPQGVVMGLALFYGGLIQLLAGMWELRVGNTFGAVAFSSYGGFWMSFAALFIKAFGFMDTYADSSPQSINRAIGIYLFAWCLFTIMMMIASHRTSGVLFALFAVLSLTFLLLAIGHWGDNTDCIQAGGAFGILDAFIAWYAGMANLLTHNNSAFTLPVYDLTVPSDNTTLTPEEARAYFSKRPAPIVGSQV